jgi:MFS family permease
MPWTLWVVIAYTLFTTGTISVFNTNATELAEQRFKVDSVTAGWYTAILRYGSFAFIPVVAVLTDVFGQRVTFMLITGCGVFTAMTVLNYGDELSGAIAAFAVFASTSTFSALVIIDSIRTVLPDQTTFGTAYALKLLANNSYVHLFPLPSSRASLTKAG